MNERIQQLCLRAGSSITGSTGQYTFDEFVAFQEKFAELIIQECMNQCEDMDDRYRIGIHFGV